MDILFKDFHFQVLEDKRVVMAEGFGTAPEAQTSGIRKKMGMVEIQCAGDNHPGFGGSHKRFGSLEKNNLKYVSHSIQGNRLSIVTRSERLEVESIYNACEGSNAIRTYNKITNISGEEVILESANSALLMGFGGGTKDIEDLYLHEFVSCHHYESQPRVLSFRQLDLFRGSATHRRVNIGSKSTSSFFPQGIIENRKTGRMVMFQIESDNDWYYELAPLNDDEFYLYLSGPDAMYHSWCKKLESGESYVTTPVAIAYGDSLNEVLAQMTMYRRSLLPYCEPDVELPVIFNEYMHMAWNFPSAELTAKMAPVVASLGVDYYVIDCGWHDDVDPDLLYNYSGKWLESKWRFPEGVAKTADLVHSYGMKFGLWIEPEVVGKDCKEMLDYYPDECFITRNGHKVFEMGRYFLDFRHPLVREYLTKAIDRMCDEYKADYIKFDYNEECGPGTELNSDSLGDGLQGHMEARAKWVEEISKRHPNVIFENCASGGQRMDYKTMSLHPLTSTSDQIHYNLYPYIVGNIFASVLPEQAAVWSYPVNSDIYDNVGDASDEYVSEELVVMNMLNAILGRVHLASRVQLLAENKKDLIREAIRYYRSMTPYKKKCVPYLPAGYASVGDGLVSVGIMADGKLFLGVWNLKGNRDVKIPLPGITATKAEAGYPKMLPTEYSLQDNVLSVHFTEEEQARLFEIDYEKAYVDEL